MQPATLLNDSAKDHPPKNKVCMETRQQQFIARNDQHLAGLNKRYCLEVFIF